MAIEYVLPHVKALAENQKNPEIYLRAEEEFNKLKKETPVETIASLVEICQHVCNSGELQNGAESFFETAVVLLKGTIEGCWGDLKVGVQTELKGALVKLFLTELPFKLRRHFGYCIEKCLENEEESNFAGEILVAFNQAISVKPESHLKSIFRFLADAGCYFTDQLTGDNIGNFLGLLSLGGPELFDIKAIFYLNIVVYIGEEEVEKVLFFVPQVYEALRYASYDAKKEILENAMDAAGKNIFSPTIGEFVNLAKDLAMDECLRNSAIECVLSVIEAEPMESLSEEVKRIGLHLMFTMCKQVEEYDSLWELEEDQENDYEENVQIGMSGLERLLRKLEREEDKDSEGLPMVFEMVQTLDCSWEQVCTKGLVFQILSEFTTDIGVLQGIAEFCIQTVLKFDSNPKVRHAAWCCFCQFLDTNPDFFDENSIPKVLETFLITFQTEQSMRVKSRACLCYANLAQESTSIETEDIDIFFSKFMKCFAEMLEVCEREDNKMCVRNLKSNAAYSISATSSVVGTKFAVYYPEIMGRLRILIERYLHNMEARDLLGSLIECASKVGKTVRKEVFKADAGLIAEAMSVALKTAKPEDPVKEYAFVAIENLVNALQEDFARFLPAILPEMFEKMQKKPQDLNEGFNDSLLDDEDAPAYHLAQAMDDKGEVKLFLMRTSELEDIKTAIAALHACVKEMGSSFLPFIQSTVQNVRPLLDFSVDNDVNGLAYSVLAALVKTCDDALEMGMKYELVANTIRSIVDTWATMQLLEKTDFERVDCQAQGLQQLLTNGKKILSDVEVETVAKIVFCWLIKSVEEGNNPDVRNCQVSLVSCLGALMHHHPKEFELKCLHEYCSLLSKYIAEKDTDTHICGLFLACDIIEFLPRIVVLQMGEMIQFLVKDISSHTLPEVVQPAVFGLSMILRQAEFGQDPLLVRQIAEKLTSYIQKTSSLKKKSSEARRNACDNVISCFGSLLRYHSSCLQDVAVLWQGFFKCLPCSCDMEESLKMGNLLVDLAEEKNGYVLQNIQEVVRILTTMYQTQHSEEELDRRIQNLVRQISLPQLEQLPLSSKQKKKLGRIWQQ